MSVCELVARSVSTHDADDDALDLDAIGLDHERLHGRVRRMNCAPPDLGQKLSSVFWKFVNPLILINYGTSSPRKAFRS